MNTKEDLYRPIIPDFPPSVWDKIENPVKQTTELEAPIDSITGLFLLEKPFLTVATNIWRKAQKLKQKTYLLVGDGLQIKVINDTTVNGRLRGDLALRLGAHYINQILAVAGSSAYVFRSRTHGDEFYGIVTVPDKVRFPSPNFFIETEFPLKEGAKKKFDIGVACGLVEVNPDTPNPIKSAITRANHQAEEIKLKIDIKRLVSWQKVAGPSFGEALCNTVDIFGGGRISEPVLRIVLPHFTRFAVRKWGLVIPVTILVRLLPKRKLVTFSESELKKLLPTNQISPALTLYDRSKMGKWVANQLDRKQKFALLIADVNGLKKANALGGYAWGDLYVQRQREVIGRLAGEFKDQHPTTEVVIKRMGSAADEIILLVGNLNKKSRTDFEALNQKINDLKEDYQLPDETRSQFSMTSATVFSTGFNFDRPVSLLGKMETATEERVTMDKIASEISHIPVANYLTKMTWREVNDDLSLHFGGGRISRPSLALILVLCTIIGLLEMSKRPKDVTYQMATELLGETEVFIRKITRDRQILRQVKNTINFIHSSLDKTHDCV